MTHPITCTYCQGEREADADIAAGRLARFADVEQAIAWLTGLLRADGQRAVQGV